MAWLVLMGIVLSHYIMTILRYLKQSRLAKIVSITKGVKIVVSKERICVRKAVSDMAQYYVVRDKNTGLYFRGKGVNRWGQHYNQASIYRVRKMAENTIKEVSWRGKQAEIVPIQIVETTADVVPKSEVAREIFEDIEKMPSLLIATQKHYIICERDLAELKKKYTNN